jgi:hypothetical protein
MMGILIPDHDPPAIILSLGKGLLPKLAQSVQWGDIYLNSPCDQVITQPDEIIGEENKSEPAMDFNGGMKRKQMENIPEPHLGACDDQEEKPQRIYPVPDPYR